MRVNPKNNFYDRPSQTHEVRSKNFYAYEGTETEKKYFETVLPCYEQNIVSLIRTGNHEGWSHPKKILNLIQNILSSECAIPLSYKEIRELLFNYYNQKNNLISIVYFNNQYNIVLNKYSLHINDIVDNNLLGELINDINISINNDFRIVNLVDKDLLINHIKEQCLFSPEVDSIYLIVDRDAGSVTEEEYKTVVNKCRELDIKLYITNPCFEFWLLLHFTKDFTDEEKKCLLLNKNQKNKKTCAYNFLKKFDGKYKKNNLKMDIYTNKIDTAINNASYFETNIDLLINSLGTNLGSLFSNFIK